MVGTFTDTRKSRAFLILWDFRNRKVQVQSISRLKQIWTLQEGKTSRKSSFGIVLDDELEF